MAQNDHKNDTNQNAVENMRRGVADLAFMIRTDVIAVDDVDG